MQHWLRSRGWLLGVLAIASFTMLFRLGDRPVENWDEGIHGAVSIDMVERGDWVTPWYAGGTYFRKPPLKLWMSAALFEAFSINAWTLRLPNAVAGIATALLVAWWMWEWRRNRLEAFLAGTIVATMRPIFFHAFRTGEMDGLLTLFTTAALYCWWKAVQCVAVPAHEIRNPKSEIRNNDQSRENQNSVIRSFKFDSSFGLRHSSFPWLILTGAATGFAIMTKSAAGLLPLPIIAADYLLHRRWHTIQLRSILVLGIWCLVIIAPWHLAMTMLHGATFWNDYFGWHVVKRATEAIHNPTAGMWWYLPTLMRKFSPFSWWLLPALLFSLAQLWSRHQTRQRGADLLEATLVEASSQLPEVQRGETQTGAERNEAEFWRGIPRANEAQRPTPERSSPKGGRDHQLACDRTTPLLLLWSLITFTLFTIAKTKFDWYLLPLYPAAAMLLAVFLATARDVARNRMTAALYLAALAIAVFALPSLYPDGSTLDQIITRVYAPFGHPAVAAILAITVVIGGVRLLRWRDWSTNRIGSFVMVIVMVIVFVPAFAVTTSHLLRTPPEVPFPAIAAAVKGSAGHLVSYGMDYKQHPAGYFILRAALSGDVRILDGRRRDVARTIAMLREREHGFLLTQNETELPKELHQVVGDPRTFGDFMLWERR